jgi:uncharacterized protein (TIGR01777 family)
MNDGILITGATGFIGGYLTRTSLARGRQVWALSRDMARARRKLPAHARVVASLSQIPRDARVDVIVNLAGAPVIGPPWTQARRRVLVDSRVKISEAVNAWCASREARPRVIISASAIGFYGPTGDDWLDESSPPQPQTFQSQLCIARENAANAALDLDIRIVNLRIGLVLGIDGGILPRLALPAKLGLASVIGDGLQWMSWIHLEDLLRIIELAIFEPALEGALNAVGPEPVRQGDFQRALSRKLRRPLWLHLPAFALRASMGEMAELLVCGQRVAPRRLIERGFEFRYATLDAALDEVLTPARS